MKCPRCGNEDPEYFYKGHRGYYCRKCIRFKRMLIEDELASKSYPVNENAYMYDLQYELTDLQKTASNQVLELLNEHYDVLLKCVCGAGKTELTIQSIAAYLKIHKKVIYAISRREVVIELAQRFKTIFKQATVCTLCEGYHEIDGDLIVCTTHQLYRYLKSVDLLILDEVDAFPFKGNQVLMNIALNSLKPQGHIIYSTATVDQDLKAFIKKRPCKMVELNQRPHGHPLIEPQIFIAPKIILFCKLIRIIQNYPEPLIVFVETKKQTEILYRMFKNKIAVTYVYSDLETRNQNIEAFRTGRYRVMIATSVLERGVTIPGVNVVILNLINGIFDESSMVQMVGRVGRTFAKPDGKAFILSNHLRKEIIDAYHSIKKANTLSLLSKGNR